MVDRTKVICRRRTGPIVFWRFADMLLDTPCILICLDRLEANISRMAAITRQSGVALRPHIKTHKSVEIARMQLAAGAAGITVAKLSEAAIMLEAGIRDIFVAYPIIGDAKIARLLDMNPAGRIIVGVDSRAGAEALSAAASQAGQVIEVRLEVDLGFARTGVPQADLVALATRIQALPGLRLSGLFAFKAMTWQGKPTRDRQAAGIEEGQLIVELADRMRQAGIAITDISVGSTPTAEVVAAMPGITEIRPGTYVFNDMATVLSGGCALADCAASVLVTVVSKTGSDRLVIDGGSKTFSTDCAPGSPPFHPVGYGRVLEDEQLVLHRFSEEHGMIAVQAGAADHAVGDRLHIVPNHICTTINLHANLTLVRKGQVIRTIPVDARGCVT
jgi:D-serine deaminase-like pyridoxal phosphate-dependent protein